MVKIYYSAFSTDLPLHKHSGEGFTIRNHATSVISYKRERKLNWDPRSITGKFHAYLENPTYALTPRPGARPTGRFARRPMRKLDSEEMAAVETMRSLWTWRMQRLYTASETHKSLRVHTQGPPDCDSKSAFTEIYIASEDKRGRWFFQPLITHDVCHGSLLWK